MRFLNQIALTALISFFNSGFAIAAVTSANSKQNIEPTVWTHVQVTPLDAPRAVRGSDGMNHLIYELVVSNYGRGGEPAKVSAFGIIDQAGNTLAHYDATTLKNKFSTLTGTPFDGTLKSGTAVIGWINLDLPATAQIPKELHHKIVYDMSMPKSQTFENKEAKVVVDTREAMKIDPPLRGHNWVVFNGFANKSIHRRALLPISNHLANAQRFAIDWIELDDKSRLFNGPVSENSSYVNYGQPVLAVADGPIIGISDIFPDQAPGVAGEDRQYPGGNGIIQQLSDGAYAFYGHLRPGSIKVQKGESVKRGQVIAHVGNSGHSTAAHLHFHISNQPTALSGDSIPYTFNKFQFEGKLKDLDFKTGAGKVEKTANAGQRTNELPEDNAVVSFEE